MIQFPLKRWCALITSVVAMSFAAGSVAGGFQLWEESGAGTGDYHAGGSAEANDASTEFYNPAGMIRLKKPQVSLGAAYIPLRVKFNGTVAGTPTNGYVKGDTNNYVPNFHIVYPVNEKVALGFGVTVPFGLKTDYPQGAATDDAATLTNLKTINLNPNVAYKVNDHFSLGAGFDALYGTADYNQAYFAPTAHLDNHLTAWGYGWNVGALYQFTPASRIGLSYRSEIVFNGKGTSTNDLTGQTNNNLTARLNLPGSLILSYYDDLNKKWAILASVYYTMWNVFHSINLHNLASAFPNVNDIVNYKNTWNLVLGFHYKINDAWMLKWGVAWDQTPTQDGYRDIRLPDADRYVAAIGVQWQVTKRIAWNLGFVHFFTGRIKIDSTRSTAPITETGTAINNTNVIGTQLSIDF